MSILRQICIKFVSKDLDKLTRNDIERFVTKLRLEKISEETKNDYLKILRTFITWNKARTLGKTFYETKQYEPPIEIRGMKICRTKPERLRPQDIIEEEDIQKLVNSRINPTEKALIMTLAESGCRASEILTLRKEDVIFDQENRVVSISVEGKTYPRIVHLVWAYPYLISLMNQHSSKAKDSPVWLNRYGSPYNHRLLYKLLQVAEEKAQTGKPINPHSFRKSACTRLGRDKVFSTEIIKRRMGWTASSKMLDYYMHVSDEDAKEALLVYNGKEPAKKERSETFEYSVCFNCEEPLEPHLEFCTKCGTAVRPLVKEKEKVNIILQKKQLEIRNLQKELDSYKKKCENLQEAFAVNRKG